MGGRGISNIDVSYNCDITKFQTGYRADGVKSHLTNKVHSQNLEAGISLGEHGSLVTGFICS